jgi:hypothetical protein
MIGQYKFCALNVIFSMAVVNYNLNCKQTFYMHNDTKQFDHAKNNYQTSFLHYTDTFC